MPCMFFISYSQHDRELARRLVDTLTLYSVPTFLDERGIRVGESIPSRLFEELDRASHVIYLIAKKSLASRWVQEEFSVAKTKQLSSRGCKILPVLIDDVPLPASVAHVKYADLRNWTLKEAYAEGVLGLLSALGLEVAQGLSSVLCVKRGARKD